MASERRIIFPISADTPDLVLTMTITGSVTREQWKRIMSVIQLAEDSFCDEGPTISAALGKGSEEGT